jgi:hypothetical protein
MEIVQSIGTTALIMYSPVPALNPKLSSFELAHSRYNYRAFLPGVVSILSHRLFEGALHERDLDRVGQNVDAAQNRLT